MKYEKKKKNKKKTTTKQINKQIIVHKELQRKLNYEQYTVNELSSVSTGAIRRVTHVNEKNLDIQFSRHGTFLK